MPSYLCHSQSGWSSPRTPSGTRPLLVQHQPNAWESLLQPTFLLPERHKRLPQVNADLSQSPGTGHPLLRHCCRVGAAMVHSYNGQTQHDKGANSHIEGHLQRWSNPGRAYPNTYPVHTHPAGKKSFTIQVHQRSYPPSHLQDKSINRADHLQAHCCWDCACTTSRARCRASALS